MPGLFRTLAILVSLASIAASQDVVPDLAAVKGMELYAGPPWGKDLLKRNGFVVTRNYCRRIFDPYTNELQPHFITADSVHNTYHVIFEDLLRPAEEAMTADVLTLTQAVRDAIQQSAPAYVSKESWQLAADFLEVGICLLREDVADSWLREGIQSELGLIDTAAGIASSPLFGYSIDYSQFKPRGFYTESPALRQYFKAMTWFGNAGFRIISDVESLAALTIAGAMKDSPDLSAGWNKIDAFYSRLLSPCDDLTPLEYAALVSEVGTSGTQDEALSTFRKAAESLRDPTTNSMVLDMAQMQNWRELTKGMRFFGKRYTPDGNAFAKLTYPDVPERFLPTGLDAMAANGSARARELIANLPEGQLAKYQKGLQEATDIFTREKSAATPTSYALTLKLAATLTAPAVENAPAFAKGQPYADKNLMSSLAMWASLRHAFILHAMQGMSPLCAPPEPPPTAGYVEPNPAFFDAMLALVRSTVTPLKTAGINTGRLDELELLVTRLRGMVEKELASTPFDEDENYLLINYADVIAGLQFPKGGLHSIPEWMCLVADVHTCESQCLEVGAGGAMPIYVAIPVDGVWHLMVGGVYSYFEFLQPTTDRLTDEAWRARWAAGQIPPLEPWTASFIARGSETKDIIAAIARGETAPDAERVHDPALDDFLRDLLLRPESPLYDERADMQWVGWCMQLAASRVGHEAVPRLLDIIRNERNMRSTYAGPAVAPLLTADDLPALAELITTADKYAFQDVIFAFAAITDKRVEKFLLSLREQSQDPEIRRRVDILIRRKASQDLTPQLLAIYEKGDPETKAEMRSLLVDLWSPWGNDHFIFRRIPSAARQEDLDAWQKQVKQLILIQLEIALKTLPAERIEEDQDRALKVAFWNVASLRIDEAVPILESHLADSRLQSDLVSTLKDMGSEAACSVLLRKANSLDYNARADVLRFFAVNQMSQAVPLLTDMLYDERRCTEAVPALEAILRKGFDMCPNMGMPDSTVHDCPNCWASVEAWKKHFDPQYTPKPFPTKDQVRLLWKNTLNLLGGLFVLLVLLGPPVLVIGAIGFGSYRLWRRRRSITIG